MRDYNKKFSTSCCGKNSHRRLEDFTESTGGDFYEHLCLWERKWKGFTSTAFLNWVSREEKERGNTDSPRQFFYDWGLDRMKNMCEREKEGSIDRV